MVRHEIDFASDSIRRFCRKWKVKRLDVFGSILRKDFRPDSDVDFVIDFDEAAEWDLNDLIDMRREMEHILGRPVDMITRFALETDSNPYFRRAVLDKIETVYAA